MKAREQWELMRDIIVQCMHNSNGIDSPDDIMESAISSCPRISEEEAEFVRDVVSGTLHFERVCEGAFNGYCDCMRRNRANRWPMYLVAYLMIFRYTAVGGHYIRRLFHRAMTTSRLIEFLEYLLNVEDLLKYSGPYWYKYYDSTFVTSSIARPLEEIAPHVRVDLIDWIECQSNIGVVRVTHDDCAEVPRGEAQRPKKSSALFPSASPHLQPRRPAALPPAEVREMLFTIPEPRLPRIDCSRPPPVAAAGFSSGRPIAPIAPVAPVAPVALIALRGSPRGSPSGSPSRSRSPSAAPSRSVSAAGTPQLSVPRAKGLCVRRVKEMLSRPVAVRLTAAALRREAHAHAQRTAAQRRQLSDVEAALCDDRAYALWQGRERRREAEGQQQCRAERRAEAAAAAARLAEQKRLVAAQNHAATQQMREALSSQAQQMRRAAESAAAERRAAAEQMRRACDERARRAVEAAQHTRAVLARGVRAEAQQIRSDARKEAERTRTQQLVAVHAVAQLRARNRQRRAAAPLSPSELREREGQRAAREAQREEESREEAQRRGRIAAERAARRSEAEALAKACEQARGERRREREEVRKEREAAEAAEAAQREAKEAQRAAEVSEALRSRRAMRRAEIDALRAGERRRRNEVLLLARDINAVEESHWQQQELGVINRTTKNQNKLVNSGFRQEVM